jgi:hypothetical protein
MFADKAAKVFNAETLRRGEDRKSTSGGKKEVKTAGSASPRLYLINKNLQLL